MERTDTGWGRATEPTPRWRLLLDRRLGGRKDGRSAGAADEPDDARPAGRWGATGPPDDADTGEYRELGRYAALGGFESGRGYGDPYDRDRGRRGEFGAPDRYGQPAEPGSPGPAGLGPPGYGVPPGTAEPSGYGGPGIRRPGPGISPGYPAPGGVSGAAPPGYPPPTGYPPSPGYPTSSGHGAAGQRVGGAPGGYPDPLSGYPSGSGGYPDGRADAPNGFADAPNGYADAPNGYGSSPPPGGAVYGGADRYQETGRYAGLDDYRDPSPGYGHGDGYGAAPASGPPIARAAASPPTTAHAAVPPAEPEGYPSRGAGVRPVPGSAGWLSPGGREATRERGWLADPGADPQAEPGWLSRAGATAPAREPEAGLLPRAGRGTATARSRPARVEWQPAARPGPGGRADEVLRADLGHPRVIAFANPKGGVHKTTATVLAAATIGSVRGRGVLAWDDNELRGTLGLRAGSARHARTVRHLVHDLLQVEQMEGAALLDRLDDYLRHAADGSYDVLAGEENPRFAQRLDSHTVRRILDLLSRSHDVICVDTGNNVESNNWRTVLEAADRLVVTTVPREDAAFAADWMLDLLCDMGMESLVSDAVTLLSCPTPNPPPLLADLTTHFSSRTRAVTVVPYDPALETGSSIEYDLLQQATRDAWLQAAATIVSGFAG